MLRQVFTFCLALCFLPLMAQNKRTPHADTLYYQSDDPFNLEQVVVTATRTQKKLKDIPVITQIVTARQIQDRGASGFVNFEFVYQANGSTKF